MKITINLTTADKPDMTIDAEHIILLSEKDESGRIMLMGETCDDSMGQQLAGLYLAVKKQRPRAVQLAVKYILSRRFRRHYYGRD